jgi:hypothetical protein
MTRGNLVEHQFGCAIIGESGATPELPDRLNYSSFGQSIDEFGSCQRSALTVAFQKL